MIGLLTLLSALAGRAEAAACVCARGGGGLPGGEQIRPWAGVVGLDYGASLSGDPDGWRGVAVVDAYGDSMAGMFMPPHLAQTVSVTATLGLPGDVSVVATVPYAYVHHLGASEMPGDVDLSALADAELTGKWGHRSKNGAVFYGASAGLSFPTGVVSTDGVATGRGVLGGAASAYAGGKLTPKLALSAQASAGGGFGPDPDGYTLAPTASVVAGLKWWPRENGKMNLSFYAMERWSGKDRKDALVYKNTGFRITDLAVAMNYTFWAEKLRSASFSVKVQAPVYQVVGDPMYAENFGASAGFSVVAF